MTTLLTQDTNVPGGHALVVAHAFRDQGDKVLGGGGTGGNIAENVLAQSVPISGGAGAVAGVVGTSKRIAVAA